MCDDTKLKFRDKKSILKADTSLQDVHFLLNWGENKCAFCSIYD